MTDLALVPIDRLPDLVPEWPLSPWSTARLIRSGDLGCVRIGRRVFVTRELLAAYISAATVPAKATGG